MKEARSAALIAWLEQFVRDASSDDSVERFVTEVDNVILRQTPEIANDPMLVLDLHNSPDPNGAPSWSCFWNLSSRR